MKQRNWKIRRTLTEVKEAQPRWDKAYQSLLSPTKSISAEPQSQTTVLPVGEPEFRVIQEGIK